MFSISQSKSYHWPVTVELPVTGGKHEKHTFDAEFKRITQGRIKEISKAIESGDMTDSDFCKEILLGWKGVHDDRGEAIPFSETARDELLDIQLVAGAIVTAFFKSLQGARTKN